MDTSIPHAGGQQRNENVATERKKIVNTLNYENDVDDDTVKSDYSDGT